MEFLRTNTAVRTMIREGKEHQLYSVMQASSAIGMKTMDQTLAELCAAGKISRNEALEKCIDRVEMERLLQKLSFKSS